MVTLVAHALLEAEGANLAADTLIFQDPPYSLEETFFEHEDGTTGNDQQTTQSRVKTLSNIVKYVGQTKAATPPLASLPVDQGGNGVVGQFWQPGAGAQQRVRKKEEPYTFTERDNRGKVYLYFCPHDKTVSLMNVQGIGWSGVPDSVEALDGKMVQVHQGRATVLQPGKVMVQAFPALDPAVFRQRVFTERQVNDAPVFVGAPPTNYEMRATKGFLFIGSETASTGGVSNKSIAKGATHHINGEELNPTVKPDLRTGEGAHQGRLPVNPIDAAVAVTFEGKGGIKRTSGTLPDSCSAHQDQPLSAVEIRALEDRLPGQRADVVDNDDRLRVVSAHPINSGESPGMLRVVDTTETAKEARTRWQNETDDNSYHSAIPANPDHAEGVTAYNLSLGKPLPLSQQDKAYMDYLRAVADWRTDWEDMKRAPTTISKKTLEYKEKEQTDGAIELIDATFVYRSKGVLPAEIAVNGVVRLDIPKLIVTQTLIDRSRGLEPRAQAPTPK
jgi:hypothetical protein